MNAKESEPFLPVIGISAATEASKLGSTRLIEWPFCFGNYYNMYDGNKMSRAEATVMGEVSLYQVLPKN